MSNPIETKPLVAKSLVTTTWLAQHIDDENLVIVDAYMANVVGKEPLVYDTFSCLPTARKLDVEADFCDHTSSQIHALPNEEQFTQAIQKLGINFDSMVVIYDNQGIYSAPRAWWTFKVMGFEHVYVLDGGLPQWLKEGRETASEYTTTSLLGNATAKVVKGLACDSDEVLSVINTDVAILDARGELRYLGKAPEPREGVRSGHIPSSKNLPFSMLLDNYTYQDEEILRAIFEERVPSVDTKIYFSCGSGITACILMLAAVSIGYKNVVLYDGSWADWGSNHSLPIE
ncbi:sulfurtransferase [Aliivibrio sp. S4TY2]|uniref:sulfurtransferase n=1 Tax=unclassified Aliivibrio TaxID=2645654 RepID=UPI002378EA25|nr:MULTISPECIES: sulfurtransferase [unclassified Aliivibrio]MDD9155661.1 sulfurtransferase [Aliivibrio sp. S4TY2]MDD9160528.1 sulfurtransferase [Aliivibrio sp. S4TY1]MDD9164574.1 sulfurtransferase [Aliivibrio sp. S4MY2]MDD9168380.1 sulfurtransferase [Aliivibrio sp. S4MY4]MDD9184908.1 sulfurtransferase [Aliivibrio sp. S4MY3]